VADGWHPDADGWHHEAAGSQTEAAGWHHGADGWQTGADGWQTEASGWLSGANRPLRGANRPPAGAASRDQPKIWITGISSPWCSTFATGTTTAELLQEYPQLKEEDVRACLLYGAETARGRYCDVPVEAAS